MSSFTAPPVKNLQARTTVGILNISRWLAVAFFAVGVGIGGITALVGLAQSEGSLFGAGVVIAFASVLYGALAYAFIGWYVDSLNLLTQIAKNTENV